MDQDKRALPGQRAALGSPAPGAAQLSLLVERGLNDRRPFRGVARAPSLRAASRRAAGRQRRLAVSVSVTEEQTVGGLHAKSSKQRPRNGL